MSLLIYMDGGIIQDLVMCEDNIKKVILIDYDAEDADGKNIITIDKRRAYVAELPVIEDTTLDYDCGVLEFYREWLKRNDSELNK